MDEIRWNYFRRVCARAPFIKADSCLPKNAPDIADQNPRRKYKGGRNFPKNVRLLAADSAYYRVVGDLEIKMVF